MLSVIDEIHFHIKQAHYMKNTYYRLLFTGLRKDTHPDQIVTCLKDTLGYSEIKIRALFTSPPRVLTLSDDKEQLEAIRDRIEAAGGRILLEAMQDESRCPFPVEQKTYKRLTQEVSKASVGKYPLTIINVKIAPDSDEHIIPSLMQDGIEDKIENHLGGNISVFATDDTRLIVLIYFSNKAGTPQILKWLDNILKDILGAHAIIHKGTAEYPDNGEDVSGLLQESEARSRMVQMAAFQEDNDDDNGRLSLGNVLKDSESSKDMFENMLIGARGKKFKWLCGQDLDTLWMGLGNMPQVRQWEFLYRLPLDSPLTAELEKAITSGKKAITGDETQRIIEENLIKICGIDYDDRFDRLKIDIPQKLKKVDSFPTLSKVALSIINIARNPESSIDELATVIKNDPSLTLTLLKVVNSAFYGFPQKIETIERAVIILGREEVVNLALGIGAAQAIDVKSKSELYKPKALWHHLMGTALICRFLYRKFNKKDEPGLFTAGLLHDFGKIFLVENYPDEYDKLHLDAVEFDIPLYELEEECFGINHAVIGKYIGSNWKLPEPLVQAAAYHHQPFFATEHTKLAATIGFADHLYHYTESPDKTDGQLVPPGTACLTYGHWKIISELFPGIQQEEIEDIAAEADAFLDENQQIFSILK